jgi:seryl-tRNA synthetase
MKVIRDNPEAVERALADRGGAELIRPLIAQDGERRRLVRESEELKALRNKASDAIGQAKRRGEDASAEQARMREVGERIKALEGLLKGVDAEIERLLLQVPNLPDPSVPPGQTEEQNVEMRRWGTPRAFDFAPKPHEEVGEALGFMDFERAARMSKARFVVLWGPLARLERALTDFMLDLHTREHGYTEVWVPHLVNPTTMQNNGLLPKFEISLFKTIEPDEDRTLYAIPTAEVPVTALHTGETLAEATLPRRYVAFTPCYRREAGTYGKDMKGMIRQHQFDKVEMVNVTTPAQSPAALETMVEHAEEVLKRLEIPYRVVLHCAGDMGFQATKSYDVEVWLPGQGRYREISSCSDCGAFQARRAEIRFKPAAGGRSEFCHTLNGSGLAVGRTLIAVVENYQEADGSVTTPKALRPYMGGVERIAKR